MVGEPLLLQIVELVPRQINPEHMEEFILPFMKAIYSEFPKPLKIYHNEGYHSDQKIEGVLRFGADIWHFGSDVHALSDIYANLGNSMVPFGGVNPHGPIRRGRADGARAETRAVLKAAKGRRLLFSTGIGTTPETTLGNIGAMVETAVS